MTVVQYYCWMFIYLNQTISTGMGLIYALYSSRALQQDDVTASTLTWFHCGADLDLTHCCWASNSVDQSFHNVNLNCFIPDSLSFWCFWYFSFYLNSHNKTLKRHSHSVFILHPIWWLREPSAHLLFTMSQISTRAVVCGFYLLFASSGTGGDIFMHCCKCAVYLGSCCCVWCFLQY